VPLGCAAWGMFRLETCGGLPGRVLENPVCQRLFFSGIGEGNFAVA
jgi:hypothetical protein